MRRGTVFQLLLFFFVVSLESFSALAVSREDAFRNFSTAPNYVKVLIDDPETGQRRWVLFESMAFNLLLIDQWSHLVGEETPLTDESYAAFIRQRAEELPIEISLSGFTETLATHLGSSDSAQQYLQRYSFERPYSLSELGFDSEAELIRAYFDFDPKNGTGQQRDHDQSPAKVWEPRLIALLLDLGYNVGRGDVAPFLYIRETSPFQ